MPEKQVKLSTNRDINKAIADERIFYATVTRATPNKQGQALPVDVSLSVNGSKSVPGIIRMEDLDEDTDHPNVSWLIGLRIPFVIKAADDEQGVLICSRKIAQQKLKVAMMNSLDNGTAYEGTITGFTNFGCFVDVNGVVGLLRNVDYSTDHSRISERYRSGDHITVKCKSVSADDRHRITWEAVTKYRRTTPFVCDLEPGAIVLGRVIDIRNFTQSMAVFVRLEGNDGLDVLCAMPAELEIEKGVPVVLRISSIRPGADECSRPRIRGAIMRLA